MPTWSVIESRCDLPATITIVGASEHDDVFGVANLLAEAASTAGRRVALLILDSIPRSRGGNGFDIVTLVSLERAIFEERCKALRSQYEVLIVAVPLALSNILGPQAMRGADGVVVAIAENRRVEAVDRAVGDLLVQLGAKTIGVVHTGVSPSYGTEFATTWLPVVKHRFRAVRQTLRSLMFRT